MKLKWELAGLAAALAMLAMMAWHVYPGGPSPVFTADDYNVLGDQLVQGFQTSMASWHMPLYVVLRGLTNEAAMLEPVFIARCLMAVFIVEMAAGYLAGGGACALLSGLGLFWVYRQYGFDFHDIQHFYCALVLLTAGLLAWRAKAPTVRQSLMVGLSLGAALLCRSTLVLFPPLLVLWEFLTRRKTDAGWWKPALIVLVVPYLFLLPWISMNWKLHHEFIPLEYGQADGNIVPGALGVVGTPEGAWEALVDKPIPHKEVLGWAMMETLRHPLRYLDGYARRLALVFSWGPILSLLALFGFWRGRSRPEIQQVSLLALYFLVMYCFMSIQYHYFKPLWLLSLLIGADGIASLLVESRTDSSRFSRPLALATLVASLGASLALCAYAMVVVGTYADKAVPLSAAALDAALQRHPKVAYLWYQRGLFDLKENTPGAGEAFKRAIALNPCEGRYRLASAFVDGKWDGPPPGHPHDRGDILLLRANAELREGRRDAAREDLKAALDEFESALFIHFRPKGEDAALVQRMHAATNTFLHGAYSEVVAETRPAEALALVREIDKLRPGRPGILLERARLTAQLGDRKAARALLAGAPPAGFNPEELREVRMLIGEPEPVANREADRY